MSLKIKFVIIFLLISLLPLIIAGGAGYYHINEISKLSISQTSKSLKEMAELLVEQKSNDVSKNVEFLVRRFMQENDDNIEIEELQYDPDFSSLTIQTIGKTGYTYLIFHDNDNFTVFLHPNPKYIGNDIKSIPNSIDFIRTIKNVKLKQKSEKGYFKIFNNGKEENIFMVITPVPNTSFFVVAQISTKEVEEPVRNLNKTFLDKQKDFLIQYNIGGIATGMIVFLVAILFAIRLVRPIVHLTEVAEKISLGDLKAPIEITSTDEIGDLADALRRMQASLRKAVQRLQRRRKGI
ncbi:HAMP domain-containing protein [Desulfohalobiaceae bacterium Ax17]|uniref:methyl-accepting chemotaxis protein n=1 Tax=Desulfovulcanus ferrireducens TaxID=2831190 RepID=UPI00207BC1A0|nr:HAMP domain-containing protein [Desulfovulcanus ferrireducens]MBT8763746.1 HAMP domain-containing protein [Desulfovulcanus ferrireducens]